MNITLAATPPNSFTIAQVVDYDGLSRNIVALCTARHFDLVEELADAIADHCLALGPVTCATITINKPDVATMLAGNPTPMIRWVKKRD